MFNVFTSSFILIPYKFQTFRSPDEIGLMFLFPVLRIVDEKPVVCQPKPLIWGQKPVLTLLLFLNTLVAKKTVMYAYMRI